MPIYKLALVSRRDVARGTVEFTFAKPAELSFLPGQYGGFTLMNPVETDAGGITRRFSILSAPDDTHLVMTTRMQQSAYKRGLNAMKIGDEIKFAGPTGNFTLHNDTTIPAVFIAGGIGITPFYSMIKHATQNQSPQQLTLFYGNQSPADTAYLDELTALQKQNSHLTLVPTFAVPDANWQGETGYITHTLIKKYVTDIHLPVYYVCGSPVMVAALKETLLEMGINEDKIKIEDFPGY